MKKILFFLLFITLGLVSCKKKEVFHKITYEVKFLGAPSFGSSNFFEVNPSPYDRNDPPGTELGPNLELWKYEYFQLKDGDKVQFGAFGQLSYYYEMRVYIDDVEVSYLRAVVSDYNYYATCVEEKRGLNDEESNSAPSITFIYHEK